MHPCRSKPSLGTRALGLAVTAVTSVSCRVPLPAAPSHSRTTPTLAGLPSLRACWIETAQAFGNTAATLVIRHPRGDTLVDVGNSTHFADEIREYSLAARIWYRLVPGLIVPATPLPASLRAMNVDPARVNVIITHAHFDHLGGMMDMPDVPVFAPRAEIDLIDSSRNAHRFEVLPAHAERVAPLLRPIAFERTAYETFDSSHDLYGDGSVVIVPLPGHTPGSIGVFVNLSASRRLFLVGDAVHDSAGFVDRVDKPWLTAITDSDPATARRTVSRIAQFHEMAPRVSVLPAHARDAWLSAFGAPGRCLD